MLMLPVLLNLALAAVCDIGLWWILSLLQRLYDSDVTEQSKYILLNNSKALLLRHHRVK